MKDNNWKCFFRHDWENIKLMPKWIIDGGYYESFKEDRFTYINHPPYYKDRICMRCGKTESQIEEANQKALVRIREEEKRKELARVRYLSKMRGK